MMSLINDVIGLHYMFSVVECQSLSIAMMMDKMQICPSLRMLSSFLAIC